MLINSGASMLKAIEILNRQVRVALAGEEDDPVVLLLHGWPECWYSWRHQIECLAQNGYRIIAPDMPGFGGSDGFSRIDDYHCENVSAFIISLLNYYSVEQCHLVGHDFGASHAWQVALRHPQRFLSLSTLSVPLHPQTKEPPMTLLKRHFGDDFYYQIYFQEFGAAEREFEPRARDLLKSLYCSPDTPRAEPVIRTASADAGGWIDRQGVPLEMPAWFSESDLDYYEQQYKTSGFEGGINYYRNIDRNWELMAPFKETVLPMSVLFMAGDKDPVIKGRSAEKLRSMMLPRVPDLEVILLPGIGHWIQQEAADEVNSALLGFLNHN